MNNIAWLLMLALFGSVGYFAQHPVFSMLAAIGSGVVFTWVGYLTAYGEMGARE